MNVRVRKNWKIIAIFTLLFVMAWVIPVTAGPGFSSITPNNGSTAGGTPVTITGTDFDSGGSFGVTIGGVAATGVSLTDASHIAATTPAHAAGAVDVVITNSTGEIVTGTGAFTYVAPPTFTSIVPPSGPIAGGTPVTITGSNFVVGGSFGVTIGGVAATGVSLTDASHITAITPAHAAGAVDVVITNNDGQAVTGTNAFTYVTGPTFTSITPNTGPTAGGTAVTITGSNFVAGGSFGVTIGGVAATGVSLTDASHITAITPAHAAGAVDVVITNNDGQAVTGTNAFTYINGPTFISITPNTGPLAGGTAVSIVGTNFISGGSFGVTIGGSNAAGVYVNSTTITATTPAHAAGPVNVVITNNDGQAVTGTNAFTYVTGPTFTSITPNTGPIGGGTVVSIVGTNFISGGSFGVTIGGSNAAGVYVNSTTITATTPAHAAGPVNVVITNNDGQTVTGTNAFTYVTGPVASFTPSATSGTTPLTVTFTDTSSNTPTAWNWSFRNVTGNNTQVWWSQVRNPQLTFGVGNFSIVLNASNNAGFDLSNQVTFVNVTPAAPVAGFSGTPLSGAKPLTVTFRDTSTGVVTSYAWNFGDGGTSIAQSPSHQYTTVGTYTVNLTVAGPGGSDFENKPNYITVTNATTRIGIYKDGEWNLDKYGNGGKGAGTDLYSAWDNAAVDLPVAGDWNADGRVETGVYRPGVGFYLKMDNGNTWTPSSDVYLAWDNAAGDRPIAGDWNADGRTETGVYRPGAGFYLKMDNGSTWTPSSDVYLAWDNAAGDRPIAGDWNADGRTETGVYRPGVGFYLKMDNGSTWTPSSDVYLAWDNAAGDLPIAGDWNADGRAETGVYRPGVGFYLKMDNGSTWTPSSDVYLAWDNAAVDRPIAGDWNADGRAETGVYRPGVGFYLKMDNGSTWTPSSGVNPAITFPVPGLANWTPIVGDWNGNGITKIGVYKDISWYLDYNGNGIWDSGDKENLSANVASTKPVVGDWNGDGKTKVGYFRWGFWILDYNGEGKYSIVYQPWFPGDDGNDYSSVSVVGDWNGNGKTEIGIYRGGTWYLDLNGNSGWDGQGTDRQIDLPGSTLVVGDWNGDGKSKIGVFNNGVWSLDYNGNGSFKDYSFGTTGSLPIIGDWNGDGKSKIGVFNNGVWSLDYNGNGVWEAGTDKEYSFGDSSWLPVVGKWT